MPIAPAIAGARQGNVWGTRTGPRGLAVQTLLLVIVAVITLYNALGHPPTLGYDGPDHLAYIASLSQGALPDIETTSEYFSPPLPYAVPALFLAVTPGADLLDAGRLALLLQWGAGLLTLVTLVRLGRRLWPADDRISRRALLLVGMLPVFYKSLAFVRGEPWVMLFTLLALAEVAALLAADGAAAPRRRRALSLGLWLGLALLSRQWALPVIGAVALFSAWIAIREHRVKANPGPRRAPWLALGILLSLVLGGWYYVYLLVRFGSLTAFNRPPADRFSPANQPAEFYLGLGEGQLFRDPVRPHFARQLLPKLYAETWGDHEAYFLIVGRDRRTNLPVPGHVLEAATGDGLVPPWLKTNRFRLNRLLGLVNIVALVPTGLLLAGFLAGIVRLGRRCRTADPPSRADIQPLIALIVLAALAAYLWFLIQYPYPGKGDTIKATYLLHIFPLLALQAASLVATWQQSAPRPVAGLDALLALAGLLISPAFFSRSPLL